MKIFIKVFLGLCLLTCAVERVCAEKPKQQQLNAVQLIAKAEIARKKAAQLGFEWSTTKGLINAAQQAADKGNMALATDLSNQAIKQAENAIIQAKLAESTWQKTAKQYQ